MQNMPMEEGLHRHGTIAQELRAAMRQTDALDALVLLSQPFHKFQAEPAFTRARSSGYQQALVFFNNIKSDLAGVSVLYGEVPICKERRGVAVARGVEATRRWWWCQPLHVEGPLLPEPPNVLHGDALELFVYIEANQARVLPSSERSRKCE